MFTKIKGIIAAASAIKRFTKTDGTVSEQAMLHIRQMSEDAHPPEVAVKVTGSNAQYARMIGYHVEVEYVIRVFHFTKEGEDRLGNDIYASRIRVVNNPEDKFSTNKQNYEI
ncbi:MAG: hypothetical protein ACI30I_01990 [Parabacteroides sp.]